MGKLLKIVGGILALALVAGLVLGFWPFIDRSAKAARPVPMPVVPLAKPELLDAFIETRAFGIDAFVIHKYGAVAFSHGAVDVPMNMASARKSVLSLLYGIAWDRGLIKLDKTLGELGINETASPLTPTELRATIEQLLQARSGVYIASGAETAEMAAARPQRGQFAPGEHHYYNNWDFNVLGVIFEAETGMRIGDALDRWLAQPLGMEDFNASHVYFGRMGGATDFPTYRMHMSARDLARIGTLILQKGEWNGKRIVSEAWLERSLAASSTFEPLRWSFSNNAYGYSWWLNTQNGAVVADGWGGQYLYVDRANHMVFVARRDTGNSGLGFLWFQKFKEGGRPDDLLALRQMALVQ